MFAARDADSVYHRRREAAIGFAREQPQRIFAPQALANGARVVGRIIVGDDDFVIEFGQRGGDARDQRRQIFRFAVSRRHHADFHAGLSGHEGDYTRARRARLL